MSKNVNATVLVGRCRSGTEILLPYTFASSQINLFIEQFSLDDQLDLFCVCEALVIRFLDDEEVWHERESVAKLFQVISQRRFSEPMASKLNELSLKVSTDFLRHGQKLLTAVYL